MGAGRWYRRPDVPGSGIRFIRVGRHTFRLDLIEHLWERPPGDDPARGSTLTSIEVPAEVTRAVAGVEWAMTRLIKLLASPDEGVRNGALAALDAMGVAAIGFLTVGLSTSKETGYRVRIIEALGALAPLSRTTVLLVLGAAALDKDPEVRKAASRVIWGVKSFHAEKTPTGTPARA